MENEEPKEITDRQIYQTAIGPVCMSRTEHAMYIEEIEKRKQEKTDNK